MRQILFTVILSFTLCSATFGQSAVDQCSKIQIKAPEKVSEGLPFQVTANFKQNGDVINELIRWKIIKDDEIVEKIDKGVIEIEGQIVKTDNSVIILAETANEKCRSFAMAKIFIEIVCRLPILIDEYGVVI